VQNRNLASDSKKRPVKVPGNQTNLNELIKSIKNYDSPKAAKDDDYSLKTYGPLDKSKQPADVH
jgi:hypothetical protein